MCDKREVGYQTNTCTTAHAQIRLQWSAVTDTRFHGGALHTFLGFSDPRSCYRATAYGLEGRGSILIKTTVLRPPLGTTQPPIPGG
jgi:hypothetical protein